MIDATPLLRLYQRRRSRQLARMEPAETQERQLLDLVRRAKETRFGRDHGFDRIASVSDFQNQVPLRAYEAFWREYWQPVFPHLKGSSWPDRIPYFAVSSGTSAGATKYLPVSREMVRSNRRAALDVFVHHLARHPDSRVFGGKNLMLSGSVDLVREAPGIHSGDLTGIANREMPSWAKPFSFPPPALSREPDWERKIAKIAEAALEEDIRNIAGTANWLLLFFDKLVELVPGERRLARFFPRLELVVHGGVAFAPYRARFEDWLRGSNAELREVYPASEGFIASADRGSGEGLRLNLDGNIFFEFIPIEELDAATPTRHWVGNVEPGQEYAVAMTTCAGLWAYLVGDTVRIVDRDPPRLVVTGRTSYFLSAFGEHLTGGEIQDAVFDASTEAGVTVDEFSVGAVFADEGDASDGHLYVVELVPGDEAKISEADFAAAIDRHLCDVNDDYRIHRAGSYGMAVPKVRFVASGSFADWMRARGKLGGQNKVPRVVNNRELFASLTRLSAERRLPHG